ncbi:MAG: AbrB/MazE/SpoVT family DNA-binding domain-containing protein [Acidobacteria bacterium]|nr:AbrB/MazE/SpoVT family DNA-binding domain-containing protein [Acidobacteriota bacterium]MBV9070892.1 AbrB/MazE/SpoVT family DNA-binding domain-containing protein [Acidobacteriota bacterium]MBV9185537.1 AbrB/MazE/SpoVT family DNA-binding domain-containing protein [Acidobacteriota bacterium]
MKRGTTSTMDSAGRLVLPREIRDQAKFEPGMPLRIVFRDGHVEIEAAPREVRVVRKGRMRVAVPIEEGATLRSDAVRETTASTREHRR